MDSGHTTEKHRETTGTLRDIDFDRGRISPASGRESDIRPTALPGDDTETTFVFTVPQRDTLEEQPLESRSESPTEDGNDRNREHPEDIVELGAESEPLDSPQVTPADISMMDPTMQRIIAAESESRKTIRKKRYLKMSKHGIEYPSLPFGVVKKLATTFARTAGSSKAKISKETLEAIMQASDWFFEQVSDDLGAYSKHAGRKTIDESDIVTLMARYESYPRAHDAGHILIFTHTQTTPDECYHNAVFSSSEIPASGAHAGVTNGASLETEERATARKT